MVALARLVVGLGFLTSGAAKLRQRRAFETQSRWLFGERAFFASSAVSVVEIAIGVVVLFGPRRWAIFAALWLVVATLYLAALFVRTNEAECMCWGTFRKQVRPGDAVHRALKPAQYAGRNGLLLAFAIIINVRSAELLLLAALAPAIVMLVALTADFFVRSRRRRRYGAPAALLEDLRARVRQRGGPVRVTTRHARALGRQPV